MSRPSGARLHRAAATAGSLLVAGILTGSATMALGRPEWHAADDFLTTGQPDRQGALASVTLVVWALVLALVAGQVIQALRRSTSGAHEVGAKRLRARAILAVGILILAGGVLHQRADLSSICCGDVARADLLLR